MNNNDIDEEFQNLEEQDEDMEEDAYVFFLDVDGYFHCDQWLLSIDIMSLCIKMKR